MMTKPAPAIAFHIKVSRNGDVTLRGTGDLIGSVRKEGVLWRSYRTDGSLLFERLSRGAAANALYDWSRGLAVPRDDFDRYGKPQS